MCTGACSLWRKGGSKVPRMSSMAVGGGEWRLETGDWRLVTGGW